jgi:hypothetical protein
MGSVTSGFTDSRGTLAFRNSELPNGEAGFCQDADDQVYITFTTGPSGCTSVSLGIYNGMYSGFPLLVFEVRF